MSVSGNYTALVQVKVSDAELEKQLKSVGNKIKPIDIKVNSNGLKNLNKELKDVNNNANHYTKSLKSVDNINRNIDKSSQSASNSVKTLGSNFIDLGLKVAKIDLSRRIIDKFKDSIIMAKDTIIDFDDTLTEFKKVSDLNSESTKNYTKLLGDMGEGVARTATEMLASATTFKKSGFSEEDSAQLAKLAELYKNIADTQVSSEEASGFLVSQMKSFNFTANDTIKILDSMNNIANNMAVGTNDLQMALEKSGSALGTLGNNFQESIALVTAGTEIMQNQGSKVGRGLK